MNMSLTRKITEGTVALSSSNLIVNFVNFLTTIILIRALDIFDFGLLALILAGFMILTIFLDLGVASVIITDVSREIGNKRQDKVKGLLLRYAQVEVAMGFILFMITISASIFIEDIFGGVIMGLVRIGSVFLMLTGIKNVFMVVFNSHLNFRYFSFMEIIEGCSKFVFVVVFILIMNGGVIEAMLIYPLSVFMGLLLSAPLLFKTVKYLKTVKMVRESLFFKSIKNHGKWAIASVSVKNLTGNLTPWIIEYFLGVSSVAIFSVATKLSNFLDGLIKSLETTLSPITSKEISNWKRTNFMLNRSIKYALWIIIPLFVISWVLAPILIEILFTESYLGSVPVFRIIMITFIIYSFGLVFRPLFFALKLQKYLFYSYLIGLLSLIILEVLLIQFIGILGAAAAVVFNSFITTLLRYYFAKRVKPDFNIDLREFLKIDEFDRKIFRKIRSKF